MSLFGKKYQLGLDIGDHSIKGASLELNSSKLHVWKEVLHPHRESREDNLSGVRFEARVKEILGKQRKFFSRSKNQVVVGIQGRSVTTGYLPLPPLKESEIELAVRSTVSREVPFPVETLDTVYLSVAPLPPDRFAVFYSAWKREKASQLKDLLKACDLRVLRMEVTGVALTRQLFRNCLLDAEAYYAIVNIGFEVTQIALVRGGYPYYLRDVPIGGRDITYAIQVGSQVSWSEAEEVKKKLPLFELMHTAGPILNELQYEIRRSVDYFCRKFPCDKIEQVFLSGGTAMMADFPEWLEEELRIPVVVESWEQLQVETDEEAAHNVAVGLALVQ